MGCLKSMAILEMSATPPFTHNRFGRQMDLSKKNENDKKDEFLRRVSVQPALCTDLQVEGSMHDRKDKKIFDDIFFQAILIIGTILTLKCA